MSLLVELVASIVKALVGLWWEKANEPRPNTVVDADRDPALRNRLEQRVRARKNANDLGSIGRTGPVSGTD